jgi:hypothetical protein
MSEFTSKAARAAATGAGAVWHEWSGAGAARAAPAELELLIGGARSLGGPSIDPTKWAAI